MYTVITKKISESIPKKLKHVNVLKKVNKSPYECLINMTPHNDYRITIHIRTITLVESRHKKCSKIPLSKEQDIKEDNA